MGKNNVIDKKTSSLYLVVVFLSIALAICIFMIFNQHTNTKIETKKQEIKKIEKTIDSIENKQINIIEGISKKSINNIKKADSLIKKLPNEKNKIIDADYDSMCKFILQYRSE